MKKKSFLILWAIIFLYGFVYSLYSVVRHLKFETYIFDLGYYDQLLWLAANGKKIFSSVIEAHPWVDHFSPTFFLLTPLYLIWESPLILLIFQSVFICFGAYPIFMLVIKRTKSNLFSLTLVFSYLTFYGLQNAIGYDFHPVALGPTLLAFIFWFYEEKKFIHFWICLALFAGLQENFLILSAALGLFLGFAYKDFKRGSLIFFGFLLTFLLLIFYVIPTFFGQSYYYTPEHLSALNVSDIIKMLYTPSSKIDVVIFAFTAFGFLPILSPYFFILLGEEFLGRFLATTNSNWWILGFHYNAILAPILAFAAVKSYEKYFKKKELLAVILLLAGTIISQIRVRPDNFYKVFKPSFYDFSKTEDARQVLKLIPKEATVASTNNLGAQISQREGLIFLTNCIEKTNVWGPDGKRCFELKPDYILADMDPDSWNNYYPDYDRESILRYIRYVQENEQYFLIEERGWVMLLKRKT